MSWKTSSKFRMKARELSKAIDRAAVKLRTDMEKSVRVYTKDEIEAYMKEYGIPSVKTRTI